MTRGPHVPRRLSFFRRATNYLMLTLCWIGAAAALLPLALVLFYVCRAGLSSVNLQFFTQLPRPPGEAGGGMKQAILGSFEIVGLAAGIGLPLGILGGIYLAEFPTHRLGLAIRFAADVLNGVPSIVLGVVAYTLLVLPLHSFNAFAGGAALAMIMIPIVLRTTEDMIRLVPGSLREASLALGVPRWRTSLMAVLPVARAGVLTGVLLAVARVAGETAPLLFTALGNSYLNFDPTKPTAALPLQIYVFAIGPYDDWHRLAWAGALVLVGLIAVISLLGRFAVRDRLASQRG